MHDHALQGSEDEVEPRHHISWWEWECFAFTTTECFCPPPTLPDIPSFGDGWWNDYPPGYQGGGGWFGGGGPPQENTLEEKRFFQQMKIFRWLKDSGIDGVTMEEINDILGDQCIDYIDDGEDYSDCVHETIIEHLENQGFGMDVDDQTDLNDCEKDLIADWFETLGPAASLWLYKVWQNSNIAFYEEGLNFGSNPYSFGGCGDAFRHALWMALNAQFIGMENAIDFGEAHECSTPPSQETTHKVMDLHNNEVGANIGDQYNIFTPKSVLVDEVCEKLESGDLKKLAPPLFTTVVSTSTSPACSCD